MARIDGRPAPPRRDEQHVAGGDGGVSEPLPAAARLGTSSSAGRSSTGGPVHVEGRPDRSRTTIRGRSEVLQQCGPLSELPGHSHPPGWRADRRDRLRPPPGQAVLGLARSACWRRSRIRPSSPSRTPGWFEELGSSATPSSSSALDQQTATAEVLRVICLGADRPGIGYSRRSSRRPGDSARPPSGVLLQIRERGGSSLSVATCRFLASPRQCASLRGSTSRSAPGVPGDSSLFPAFLASCLP